MLQRAKLKLYESITRLRPEQLGVLAKAVLRVPREAVKDSSGCTFWVDPVSPFGLALLRKGTYEPQMKALVQGLLGPRDTFIDLGANQGYFSVIAASVASEGRVLSVEPQPAMQPILLENVRLNRVEHMTVCPLAISDRSGQASLHVRSSINHGASRLGAGFRLGFGETPVQTVTLGELCAQHKIERARLLKIDCEGAEVQIIAGAADVLARQAFDVIALEYHPAIIDPEACRKIHTQVTGAGYKLAQWKGQTIYYLPAAAEALAALSAEIKLDAAF